MKPQVDRVTLAATGTAWMGRGIKTVESEIEDLIGKARSSIVVVAYAVGWGGMTFLDRIHECLGRGIQVTIILNRFSRQDTEVQSKIHTLIAEYPYFTAMSFEPSDDREALHAKVLVIDNSVALVGSANLSLRGLVLNHELGLVLTGPSVVKISGLLRDLSQDHRTKKVT